MLVKQIGRGSEKLVAHHGRPTIQDSFERESGGASELRTGRWSDGFVDGIVSVIALSYDESRLLEGDK